MEHQDPKEANLERIGTELYEEGLVKPEDHASNKEADNGALSIYLRQMSKYDLLNEKQEREHLTRIDSAFEDLKKTFLGLSASPKMIYRDLSLNSLSYKSNHSKNRAGNKREYNKARSTIEDIVEKKKPRKKDLVLLSSIPFKKPFIRELCEEVIRSDYKSYSGSHPYIIEGQAEFRQAKKQMERQIKDYRSALEDFVNQNLRLVIKIANRFYMPRIDKLDLIQEGNIGLVRAAELFDLKKDNKFSTYAVWWIFQSITRYIAEKGRVIKEPVYMNDYRRGMIRAQKKLFKDLERNPTVEEVAEITGLPIEIVEQLSMLKDIVSLNTPIDGAGELEIGDTLECDRYDPFRDLLEKEKKAFCEDMLHDLTPREETILRKRFAIGSEEHTLEEVGAELEVCRERIRQVEAKAKKKLAFINSEAAKKFFD